MGGGGEGNCNVEIIRPTNHAHARTYRDYITSSGSNNTYEMEIVIPTPPPLSNLRAALYRDKGVIRQYWLRLACLLRVRGSHE